LITVLTLLFPWLTIGWIAVRKEHRRLMFVFLGAAVLYLGGWAAMFAASTFRWTFVQWTFFGVITSASSFLTVFTFVLGVICCSNFGKGLSRYLNAHQIIEDSVEPYTFRANRSDPEKVAFPQNRTLPSFSAAFGKGDEVPVPAQMKFGTPVLGPRFNSPDSNPFDRLPSPGPYEREHEHQSLPSPSASIYSQDQTVVGYGHRDSRGSFHGPPPNVKGWVIE